MKRIMNLTQVRVFCRYFLFNIDDRKKGENVSANNFVNILHILPVYIFVQRLFKISKILVSILQNL